MIYTLDFARDLFILLRHPWASMGRLSCGVHRQAYRVTTVESKPNGPLKQNAKPGIPFTLQAWFACEALHRSFPWSPAISIVLFTRARCRQVSPPSLLPAFPANNHPNLLINGRLPALFFLITEVYTCPANWYTPAWEQNQTNPSSITLWQRDAHRSTVTYTYRGIV